MNRTKKGDVPRFGGIERLFYTSLFLGTLTACTGQEIREVANGTPLPYHDTRLQYALLSGDEETLRRDFRMSAPASPVERTMSVLALPFAAATETAFLPLSLSLRELSDLGSPPPGKTLK